MSKTAIRAAGCLWAVLLLAACKAENRSEPSAPAKESADLQISVKEPAVIQMKDYSGFEKVGSLGKSLPASDRQMTAQAGDILLYNDSQIVIFYGSNSWSYTKLARIDDLSGWEEALGNGDVTVTFSIGE